MVKRIGKWRRNTRHKLRKGVRSRGKISISRYLQAFNIGDRVYLKLEPAIHKGIFFPRFHGKSGVVKGKKGRCYEVLIKDINKEKTLIVHPIHMRKA